MKAFYFVLLLGVTFFSAIGLSARDFNDNDVKRVLYLKKKNPQMPLRFLILENILPSGVLDCRIFGATRTVKLRPDEVIALDFYEDSSNFMITQYALQGIVARNRSNLPLKLARLNNDNTGRVNTLAQYVNDLKSFGSACQKLLRNHPSGSQEQDDALNDLLQKNKLLDNIKRAAAAGDWALAIAMYDVYADNCLNMLVKHFFMCKSAVAAAKAQYDSCEKELVLNFARKFHQPNVRRNNFLKLYPGARGIWSQTPPGNYKDLRNLFEQSMRSYIRADQISKLFEPQEWGTAILDALLLVEGAPCAAELEKEFDTELLNMSKRSAQK